MSKGLDAMAHILENRFGATEIRCSCIIRFM